MPRRVSLPGASELFRATQEANESVSPVVEETDPDLPVASVPVPDPAPAPASIPRRTPSPAVSTVPGATGRIRHDEKITVYVSSDELMALEEARLHLRRHHGLAVDRGRIVRAAIALAMADLADHGGDGALVEHLRGA